MYTLLGYDLKLKLNHVVDWSDLKVDTLTDGELESCLRSGFEIAGCRIVGDRLIKRMEPLRVCKFRAYTQAVGDTIYGAVKGTYYNNKGVQYTIVCLYDLITGDMLRVLVNEASNDKNIKVATDNGVIIVPESGLKKVSGLCSFTEEEVVVYCLDMYSTESGYEYTKLFLYKNKKLKFLADTMWRNIGNTSIFWSTSIMNGYSVLKYISKSGKVKEIKL